MAYGDFEDLIRRTAVDKVLRDKTFNIAKNSKYNGYQPGLVSMFYKFFDKKTASLVGKSTSGGTVKNKIISNKELVEDSHKPIIRKVKKRKVHSSFIDIIWGADLADMQLISKFNKGFTVLLCAFDVYSKNAWGMPLKDKKGIAITNAFQKVLDESKCKPNKIWLDKGSEFYNRSMK